MMLMIMVNLTACKGMPPSKDPPKFSLFLPQTRRRKPPLRDHVTKSLHHVTVHVTNLVISICQISRPRPVVYPLPLSCLESLLQERAPPLLVLLLVNLNKQLLQQHLLVSSKRIQTPWSFQESIL